MTSNLDLDNVQGDILLSGLPKKNETFFFFTILDAKSFCSSLKRVVNEIAHTLHTVSARDSIGNKGNGGTAPTVGGIVPTVGANIAFSFQGLQKMSQVLANLDLNTGDRAFEAGMRRGAVGLNDPLKPGSVSEPAWGDAFPTANLHGIILVAGSDDSICRNKLQKIQGILGSSVKEINRISGKVRPGAMKGHEHFGFMDGVSEPAVADVDTNVPPGQDTVQQGVILCGRPGAQSERPEWMNDGSFLCFRKLQQNVPEWNKFLVDASNDLGTWSGQLGSRLIGRWPSGCPVQKSPDFDDIGMANDANRVNDFEFDSEDKVNFKCPLGSHIRKMNPRGDLSREFVSQFRILRRGIPYGEEVDADPNGQRGLLFVCYQSDISKGFQFLQQTWANNSSFRRDGAGLDAVMGQDNRRTTVDMMGLNPQNETRKLALSGINRFVVPKGGEYFFSPSMTALRTTLTTLKDQAKL